MGKNSKDRDGRGKSPGSRKTQFSSDNQPARRKGWRKKIPEPMIEMLRKLQYEKISLGKEGKGKKLHFIEALFRQMRQNVIKANLKDQLKYVVEMTELGVFELEEYKQRLHRRFQAQHDRGTALLDRTQDTLKKVTKAYHEGVLGRLLYKTAFYRASDNCTCGACDDAFADAMAIVSVAHSEGECEFGDEPGYPDGYEPMFFTEEFKARSEAGEDFDFDAAEEEFVGRSEQQNADKEDEHERDSSERSVPEDDISSDEDERPPSDQPSFEDDPDNDFYTGMLGPEDVEND